MDYQLQVRVGQAMNLANSAYPMTTKNWEREKFDELVDRYFRIVNETQERFAEKAEAVQRINRNVYQKKFDEQHVEKSNSVDIEDL